MPSVIGIEGYFKTGKTSLANKLSKEFDIPVFEIGVLYRIIASKLSAKHLSEKEIESYVTSKSLSSIMDDLDIVYNMEGSFYSIPNDIYTPGIDLLSSKIGALTLGKWYDDLGTLIKNMSESTKLIVVGRNLLRIYPQLDAHIFLSASLDKIVELAQKDNPKWNYETARNYVIERDKKESLIRDLSLKRDDLTILVNISGKSADDVFNYVAEKIS